MPDPASDFDALASEFYAVWFRFHPDQALVAGLPGLRCLLPAQDDDELGALAGWLESFLLGLDEVDCRALDPDRQVDYALMAAAARVEHWELRVFDWRRRDPLRFLPWAAIHRLTLEPPEGLEDWLAALLARLPEYLRNAQGELRVAHDSLAPTLVRVAAREAEAGRCYLRKLVQGTWLRSRCRDPNALESLAEQACDALADFQRLLTDEVLPVASGPLGAGEGCLMRRLAELHFIDTDGARAAAALGRALSAVEAGLRDCAAPLATDAPARPRGTVPAQAAADGPDDYQTLCDGLRREIAASGVVTLPEVPLRVAVRPPCPGAERFGVAYRPGVAEGTFYLPPGGVADGRMEPEPLRDDCLAGGWGGAHLLAFRDPSRASRLPRSLANAQSLTVGWHLYLDRLLVAQGGSDPGRRRACLVRQRERLGLARLELDLHRGRVDAEGALARLAALGLEGTLGEARLAGLARCPGDALAGALGWLLLEAAREEQEQAEGGDFSPRQFHDRLLAQGAVPLPLALGAVFGERLWGRAFDRVFGAGATAGGSRTGSVACPVR
jgi:Bacterial protein of unknown function (DUF885)